MSLSAAEAELFKDLEPSPTVTAAEAPAKKRLVIDDIPSPEDEDAKLEAEFAARKAKIAADKLAKAEAAKAAEAALSAAAKADAKKAPPESGVLPPDAPKSDPALAAEQPAQPKLAKGKAAAAGGPATVTLTVDLATFDKIRALLK